jgi:MerR family transcriptional regulator, copper efflux regulator
VQPAQPLPDELVGELIVEGAALAAHAPEHPDRAHGQAPPGVAELAERAGISTKAIRYYEQIGILAPPARTASGYRAYDETALGRLGFVRAAQAVGLTLGEIRQIIAFRDDGQAPCAHVTGLLQRHAADLDARIGELQQLRGELRQLAERATTLDPEHCPPERVCHIIT